MAKIVAYPKIARIPDAAALRARLAELGYELPCDDAIQTAAEGSPLADPIEVFSRRCGNRWCVHPMEGWDGTPNGEPTDATLRRWRHFGLSGAKLIWGGEAAAVVPEGRANPNQLLARPENKAGLSKLLDALLSAHRDRFGTTSDLIVGLQLTHSGRFCRPNEKAAPEPLIAYHHPILDRRMGIEPDDDSRILRDDDLERLIDAYVIAARTAGEVGFDFVDVKSCHGYLIHELLGAHTRPGKFGGSFKNRTRLLRTIVKRILDELPDMQVGVRISAFDILPYTDDPATRQGKRKGVGVPETYAGPFPYRYGFAVDEDDPNRFDLTETHRLVEMLEEISVSAVNVSCGSPYYNPHIQRPAVYPPSDGYLPPEDPLAGVARQISVTRELSQKFPAMVTVGTGYTYLQEYLPHVAQAVVREGWADFVGLGRMVLSYPELPADCLEKGSLDTKRICRTFSDCTTAPRNGLPSGCYPLDAYYKTSDHAVRLRVAKRGET